MGNRSGLLVLLIVLVIAAVFLSGCSDDGSSGTVTTVPTTESAAKFATGDIVAKTATSTDTLVLIVKYDSSADKYERALVYRKSDGTYYRKDSSTDLLARSSLEKLYPAKVTHVSSLTQVPVSTPTTLTTATTATVTTTATTTYDAPIIGSITPNTGLAGTTVTITSIAGSNFRSGVTVRLSNVTTTTTISASSVVAESSTKITCYITIPSTAIAGAWNVTVTNPDGKKSTLANAFTITNATSGATPTVSGITPASGFSGKYVDITNLAGTNLLGVTSVKLQKSGLSDISATNMVVVSATKITCTFNLNGKTAGVYNVVATDSSSQSGTGSSLFTIYPVADFSANIVNGSAPLAVSFEDLSAGSPTIWSWTFGDGNTSAVQSPAHTYVTSGTYSVSLTVSNGGVSNSTTRSSYITVG